MCQGCGQGFTAVEWRCPVCGHQPLFEDGRPVFAPELAKGGGFDATYRLPELMVAEASHFWFQARRRLLTWALERYFPEARSFFEIGCGTGFILEGVRKALPSLVLSGSDVLTRGLSFAGPRLRGIELVQMDARRIPFREEFDAIGAFDVLEHITEDEEVLAEMARALRPRGGLLLTAPQHPFLWSAVDDYSHHRRRYRRRELTRKVRKAGFVVLRVTSFFSVTLPLLILSRLRQPRSPESVDPTAELRIGGALNAALEALLTVERGLIRSGLSFPAGGSLLLAARKVA